MKRLFQFVMAWALPMAAAVTCFAVVLAAWSLVFAQQASRAQIDIEKPVIIVELRNAADVQAAFNYLLPEVRKHLARFDKTYKTDLMRGIPKDLQFKLAGNRRDTQPAVRDSSPTVWIRSSTAWTERKVYGMLVYELCSMTLEANKWPRQVWINKVPVGKAPVGRVMVGGPPVGRVTVEKVFSLMVARILSGEKFHDPVLKIEWERIPAEFR